MRRSAGATLRSANSSFDDFDEAALINHFAYVVGCLVFCAQELDKLGYRDFANLISNNVAMISATSGILAPQHIS
jgi:hypothetical protein